MPVSRGPEDQLKQLHKTLICVLECALGQVCVCALGRECVCTCVGVHLVDFVCTWVCTWLSVCVCVRVHTHALYIHSFLLFHYGIHLWALTSHWHASQYSIVLEKTFKKFHFVCWGIDILQCNSEKYEFSCSSN